tara:strand:- start:1392 stop:1658 length:267 start_codon:yes stop_codon:yes gene_type:complete
LQGALRKELQAPSHAFDPSEQSAHDQQPSHRLHGTSGGGAGGADCTVITQVCEDWHQLEGAEVHPSFNGQLSTHVVVLGSYTAVALPQ